MKWLRKGVVVIDMIVIFLLVWTMVFGVPLALGALARFAGAGNS
jgi:hypothetical protein